MHSSGDHTPERRRFSRIELGLQGTLTCNDISIQIVLLDISLKGALLVMADGADTKPIGDSRCTLALMLGVGEHAITMKGTIRHVQEERFGFACDEIDLDSAGHLKRLVELNLGDLDLLDRELGEFAFAGETP